MKKGKRRIVEKLPNKLMKEIRRSQALIAKELPDLIVKHQRICDAKAEPTFSGALRRAIHSSKLLFPDLADRARTDMNTLDRFLTGEKPLTSDVIDRLVDVLRLKLHTTNAKPKPRSAKAGESALWRAKRSES